MIENESSYSQVSIEYKADHSPVLEDFTPGNILRLYVYDEALMVVGYVNDCGIISCISITDGDLMDFDKNLPVRSVYDADIKLTVKG